MYRPDIDGLRAVAVLSVLVYHAFPTALPGGFIGVDIFFVISGFLISRIILGGLKRGTFTFTDFYSRRIRRIFPALAVVLLATLVFGWWVLLPTVFRDVATHVTAGAGFASNLLLWYESGKYFGTAAELRPLLHLWSLGVEEQYYLVWPLLLYLVGGDGRNRILWLIFALAGASFAVNIYLVGEQPSAAFYLPQSRFWELMLGSIIAYAHVRWPTLADTTVSSALRQAAATGGTLFVAAGLYLINEDRVFPGWWALLPTVGTALLIAAGPRNPVNRILASRGLVLIGLISYPLYLWHWPLLTYARILNGGEAPAASIRVGALVVAAALAWLTYELIEKRIRHLRPVRFPEGAVAALTASVAALGVYGVLAYASVVEARSADVEHLSEISAADDDWGYGGDRVIAGDTKRSVLFVGDSHMQQFLPRVVWLMREHQAPVHTVILNTMGGCPPIPGIERTGHDCNRFVQEAFEIAHRPEVETVIFGARWPGPIGRSYFYEVGDQNRAPIDFQGPDADWALQKFEAALTDLVASGKEVVLVLSSPRSAEFDPRGMAARVGLGFEVNLGHPVPRSEVVGKTAYIDDRLERIARRAGAKVIDPVDFLCDAHVCPTVDKNGKPLYKDNDHVRATVAIEYFTAFDKYVYDKEAGRDG